MRIYRFFTEKLCQNDLFGDVVISKTFESSIFNQLSKVLRAKVGDRVILLSGLDSGLVDYLGIESDGGLGEDLGLKSDGDLGGGSLDSFEGGSVNRSEYKSENTSVLEPNGSSVGVFLNDSRGDQKKTATKSVYFEYIFDVNFVDNKKISLKFVEKVENKNEITSVLQLVLCLPNKPNKLEFVLEKAVELGVTEVILVNSDHSCFKHNLNLERLYKVVKEASEQSERAFIPKLVFGGRLLDFLGKVEEAGLNNTELNEAELNKSVLNNTKLNKSDLNNVEPNKSKLNNNGLNNILVALERSDSLPINQLNDLPNEISVIIGPEGGFSETEKSFFIKNNLTTFSLGKRILRTETAVILSLGILSTKF